MRGVIAALPGRWRQGAGGGGMAEAEAGGDGEGGGPSVVDCQHRLGTNGHDYAESPGADEANGMRFADAEVHAMLTKHLRAQLGCDCRRTDSIQAALMGGGGVCVRRPEGVEGKRGAR